MANENPNYYAIIPASVRYNEELSFLEKFLYCEFTALSNLNGYCTAKNKYFAELYDKDEKTISRSISRLEKLGFIRLEYEKTGARVTKRRIYLTDQKSASDKIVNRTEITSDKNITREQEKFLLTSDKIVKENNSNYNTLISLILDYYKEKDKKEISPEDYEFTDKVKTMVYTWLGYKKEKGQTYKPTGLKTLLNNLIKWQQEFGEDYVISAIDNSMQFNYSGIFPAKKQYNLNNQPKKYGDGDAYEYVE